MGGRAARRTGGWTGGLEDGRADGGRSSERSGRRAVGRACGRCSLAYTSNFGTMDSVFELSEIEWMQWEYIAANSCDENEWFVYCFAYYYWIYRCMELEQACHQPEPWHPIQTTQRRKTPSQKANNADRARRLREGSGCWLAHATSEIAIRRRILNGDPDAGTLADWGLEPAQIKPTDSKLIQGRWVSEI